MNSKKIIEILKRFFSNEIVKLGLTLMLIGLTASLALALTNYYTENMIKRQQSIELKNSLAKVMPDANHFEEKPGSCYNAYKGKAFIGRVLKVEAQGYSSVIQLLVGLDEDNNVVGVAVLSQVETPGLGANVEKSKFLSQFEGKSASELALKKDNGKIDAITGATVTSRAVTDALKKAIEDCPCSGVAAAEGYGAETTAAEEPVIEETVYEAAEDALTDETAEEGILTDDDNETETPDETETLNETENVSEEANASEGNTT